jgi:hypothetical protein
VTALTFERLIQLSTANSGSTISHARFAVLRSGHPQIACYAFGTPRPLSSVFVVRAAAPPEVVKTVVANKQIADVGDSLFRHTPSQT